MQVAAAARSQPVGLDVPSGLRTAETWILRTGLFLLPLAYAPFTYDRYVLPKLALARLLVAVLLALHVARMVAARRVVVRLTSIDLPLLVFVASGAVSTVFAQNVNVAVFGTYSRYDGLLTLLTYALLFWLAVQVIRDVADARTLMRVVVASGYVVAALAIVQSTRDTVQGGAIAPAYGTLGNPNVLGSFLAMVMTLACGELVAARSAAARLLLLNVLVVAGLALLLSLSRSAWVGTAAGMSVAVIAGRRGAARWWVVGGALVVLSGALAANSTLSARALTLVQPSELGASRFQIWGDSLSMIASRPVLGFGPDNVGLVFPRFQTGDWGVSAQPGGSVRQQIDKTHAELLQVAATQGLVGLFAYVVLLGAFLRRFWLRRKVDGAGFVFGAWLAYQLTLQVNFTAIGSALPFWIFAAAAVASWGDATRLVEIRLPAAAATALAAGAACLGAALVALGVVLPLVADVALRQAVDADFAARPTEAAPDAERAAVLGPYESVYATEVGNIAFEQGRWAAARDAYRDAAALGSFNPLVYRNLALADRNLGLAAEAKDAARKAVELDRFDPANQALLAEFGS